MQYIQKFATPDQITQNVTYKETVGEKYFDKHGALQPGHANKFEIRHFSLLALMEWAQQNAHTREELYKKHRLRFITHETVLKYEVQTLIAMMHWDTFNKSFKFIALNNSLKKKGTSFKKLHEKAELMLKEEERLSTAKFKRGMRYGRKFHAAVRIQEWWLRKKRKYRIYKNIYQLMDEYSVEGGFTGQDSRKYFGKGRSKNLLKIQEDFINKVLDHQMAKRAIRPQKCKEASKKFMKTVLQGVSHRRRLPPSGQLCGETVYSFMKYRSAADWAEDGGTEPYLCAPCATTDYSYPGSGRASGNLVHPRWAAQCSKCSKKNPFHRKKEVVFETPRPSSFLSPGTVAPPPSPTGTSCDEGPIGDEGPPSWRAWSGKWFRRLGLTK